MTYLTFLVLFVALPLVVAAVLFRRELDREGRLAMLMLTGIVYVSTSVWDNAAVAMGLWGFAPKQNLGLTIGYLPLEEYLFFGMQTWLVGLWILARLRKRMARA